MKDKTETYIGFAIKKGSVIYGVDKVIDAVTRQRHHRRGKRVFLVLATKSLSTASRERLDRIRIVNDLSTDTDRSDTDKSDLTCGSLPICTIEDYSVLQNKNCKALAITDYELAKAIWKNLYMPREEK